jgi:salicylate hydroxylase
MTQKTISIAIIGGGIGGLSAAASLRCAGFDVHVYEQARTLREVGAGIVISPNATRILHGLGLAKELEKTSIAPLAWRQRRWKDGRTLLCSPLAEILPPPFGYPLYTAHRADILAILAAALPADRLHLGYRLTSLADNGERVTLQFENNMSITADAVTGADGIHSTVRGLLFGAEQAQFTGCIAYRGLVPAARLAHLRLPLESQLWLGPGKHFVHYPVSANRLVNFVCLIERDSWTKESWTEPGRVADVLEAYEDWHEQVRAIIAAAEETFIWGLFDREPLKQWSVGRVTLLGDACHPMLPFLAQGAAQAIEDGATLARCFASASDIPAALKRYEALRLPRTAKIQMIARGNMRRNHLPDGPEQRERDNQMATGHADWSIGATAWIYNYDAAAADDGNLGLPAVQL